MIQQLPLLVALVALWMLLWDDLSWANLLSGIVLAVLVTRLLYLPPVELSGRFNLYWAAVFGAHFMLDLIRSSWQVARLAFRFGYVPRNAVMAVNLRTSSDLLMTITGHALTLIPGSLIIEVDRQNTTLYVHVLDVGDDAGLEAARRDVLRVEERLIRTMGTRAELAALDAETGAQPNRSKEE